MMKKYFLSLSAAALLIFSVSSCKVAEEDAYGRYDADSNALLDENEFGVAWNDTGYYDRWDADADGMLNESEWNAGFNSYWGDTGVNEIGAFDTWDADADGYLGENEFRDGVFETYDADRDGFLADNEYGAWWEPFGGI